MSPKPVDVRRALEALRLESPTPEQTERLLHVLHRPARRRNVARPLAFAMITAALALALVFPPRVPANAAWAVTVAHTLEAPSYSVERGDDGKITMQEWRDGRKRAHVLYFRDGKPGMEWRDDGVRNYNFAGNVFSGSGPNAHPWGDVSRSWGGYRDFQPHGSIGSLLRQKGIEIVAHEEAAGGKPETYRLRVPRPWLRKKEEQVAELDAQGRVVRLTTPGQRQETLIQYPSSIPAAVFEPRPHAITGVDVFDMAANSAKIERTIRRGLGTQGPVTLRAALLTGDGDLWVFWTGALPDLSLKRPYSVPGVRCGFPFTNRVFTTDWKSSPKMNGVPQATTGPRLGGMGRTPLAKLGSTVDLDVPYAGGVARFRRVPIIRLGLIQHAPLGTSRDFR